MSLGAESVRGGELRVECGLHSRGLELTERCCPRGVTVRFAAAQTDFVCVRAHLCVTTPEARVHVCMYVHVCPLKG